MVRTNKRTKWYSSAPPSNHQFSLLTTLPPGYMPLQAKGLVCVLSRFGHVQLFATLWTVARQAPLFMGFSRQEYWNGLPCPSPEDLPDSGIKPVSLTSPALAGAFLATSTTWEAHSSHPFNQNNITIDNEEAGRKIRQS